MSQNATQLINRINQLQPEINRASSITGLIKIISLLAQIQLPYTEKNACQQAYDAVNAIKTDQLNKTDQGTDQVGYDAAVALINWQLGEIKADAKRKLDDVDQLVKDRAEGGRARRRSTKSRSKSRRRK